MTVARRAVLLVEDDDNHARLALRALDRVSDLDVDAVPSLAAARAHLAARQPDLVLVDLHLPDGSGLALLDQETPVIVQTSQGDEARAVEAMKGGAVDYCVKSPEMYRDLPIILERALNASRNLVERRRAERSLRESDARFRELAATIPEVFWLVDIETRALVYTSPAWERVYGAGAPRTWDGRLTHVHDDDRAVLAAAVPSEGDVVRVVDGAEQRFIEERRFLSVGVPGQPPRLSCLAVDVTRRRELEASLLHAQKMQAIGQLAGGVAHDFNNMLTAILAAAYELKNLGADAELCELISSASLRASELTKNLLSFSRRSGGGKAVVAVDDAVNAAVALLRRSIPRAVVVDVDLAATGATVIGDAAQLQSVFLNLGINARDAVAGAGKIRFSSRVVHLDDAACRGLPFGLVAGDYVEVNVVDDGSGIDPAALPHIFEPFFTTKSADRGTGIGLAAVYGAVLDHRGAVTVRSRVGEGSTFRVLLPRSGERPVAAPSSSSAVTPAGRGLVLLVDDEAFMLRAGRLMLERLGYRVLTAADGEEGWEVFRARKAELAAVVSDVSMPKLSGPALVQRILDDAPGFPCLLCSGYAGVDRATLPAPLLDKPFSHEAIGAALAAALATSTSMATATSTST